jgi:uncharacterized protein YkwD
LQENRDQIPHLGEVFKRYCCQVVAVRSRPLLASLLAALTGLVLALPATAATASTKETSLLREMNRVRDQHGLGALRFDGHLQRAARSHSREMVATNVFSHGAFGSRMLQFAVTGSIAGENLAWGTGSRGTARGIVASWLASPEHRANLLRPSFVRVGVGDLRSSFLGHRGAQVVTADFAG